MKPVGGRTPSKCELEPGEEANWLHEEFAPIPANRDQDVNKTRRVARVLHQRFEKEVQRWRNYEALFAYIAFALLFLTVLYLQSNAHTAYQIHSSIKSIAPLTSTMASSEAILKWIQTTLKARTS